MNDISMNEQVILVDEKDGEIGAMEKLAAHQNGGALHRAFSIFIFNEQGKMLLQQRSAGKYHFGGLWTNACCSHPRPGEKTADAAQRRLREEFNFGTPLQKLFSFAYQAHDEKSGLTEREFDHVFIGNWNGAPQPNADEIGDWKWIEVAELRADIAKSPARYTPWFRIVLEQVLEHFANGAGSTPGFRGARSTKTMSDFSSTQKISRLHREDVLLLIVDVQQRLMPAIFEAERVEKNCVLLARAARQLGLPVLITEQNPRHLGKTSAAICEVGGDAPVLEKMSFSACTESVLRAIEDSGRKTILLCGAESHVCVMQTALDLRAKNFQVFAARDAISSRTLENAEIGWQRMMGAGVLPTSTESAVFELLREAGTPEFRAMLPLLK
jgi:isopentenyl-diphosphate delta-isomerase